MNDGDLQNVKIAYGDKFSQIKQLFEPLSKNEQIYQKGTEMMENEANLTTII